MASWQVYYQHWAKDANQAKKLLFSGKAHEKTILKIYNSLGLESPEDKQNFQDCAKEMVESFPYLEIPDDDSVESLSVRMTMLRNIGEELCPSHLPLKDQMAWKLSFFQIYQDQIQRTGETPWFILSPSEERFLKNTGLFEQSKFKFAGFHLATDNVRRLDAILALF